MILNNTQANIFKVNGGIADNFANRPAASGSFYIFYSIDTQEIYYDNNAWILIGSSAGGGVNIYNNNGTLTGNRTLSGASNDLTFADLNVFKTSLGGNDIGLKLDFANNEYFFGDPLTQFSVYTNISNRTIYIGDQGGNFNGTVFDLNDVAQNIQTLGGGYTAGIRLNFINSNYVLGQYQGNNTTFLEVDDTNKIIKTSNQGNDIGLKLDFANSVYQFGQITGGNYTQLFISDVNQFICTTNSNITNGLLLNFNIRSYIFGQQNSFNETQLRVDDINQKIFTKYAAANVGILLDFGTQQYEFGQITGGNGTGILFVDTTGRVEFKYNGNTNGIILDHQTKIYTFGQGISGFNDTRFQISDLDLFPLQFQGNNITQNTSGSVSGKHLKVKINGADYVIELKNP